MDKELIKKNIELIDELFDEIDLTNGFNFFNFDYFKIPKRTIQLLPDNVKQLNKRREKFNKITFKENTRAVKRFNSDIYNKGHIRECKF